MGIRDRPIAALSPWQNGCAERLIGSIRRDCLDHVVVFGAHLRHLLRAYKKYYNEARTHLSLEKDAPIPRDAGSAYLGRAAPPVCPSVSFRQGQGYVRRRPTLFGDQSQQGATAPARDRAAARVRFSSHVRFRANRTLSRHRRMTES